MFPLWLKSASVPRMPGRPRKQLSGRADRVRLLDMNRRRFLVCLPFSIAVPVVFAGEAPQRFPRTAAVPGGVARIPFGAAPQAPRVRVRGERVLVMREGSVWVALVGIPLATAAGSSVT